MKILLTGGTGYVGGFLGKELVRLGHQLVCLTRDTESAWKKIAYPCEFVSIENLDQVQGIEAVVNLAGASVASKRWTTKYKEEMYESRVDFTRNILEKINREHLQSFISASAIGIYPDSGDEVIKEDHSQETESFIGKLCVDWEQEVAKAPCRSVCLRIGMVLGQRSASLNKLTPLFRSGLGASLGSGNQYMSWIHVEDLVNLIVFTLDNPYISGAINAVSPEPVRNRDFTKILADHLGVGLYSPSVPRFGLMTLYGEMGGMLLLSHRIVPTMALELGFEFKYKDLAVAFKESITPLKTGEREVFVEQWIPKERDEAFEFFRNEKNLEILTPEFLNFKVINKTTDHIEKGTLINYSLRLHGIKVYWRTLISEWTPPQSFVDDQVKGPYSKWHHTHEFLGLGGGTLMTDHVVYKIPVGLLGRIFGGWKVRGDVRTIFGFRQKKVHELFGGPKVFG